MLFDNTISVRAFNVCKRHNLHNFEGINNYYKVYRSFINFRNLGAKTNTDLIRLCQEHKDIIASENSSDDFEDQQFDCKGKWNHPLSVLINSLSNKEKLTAEYIYQKLKLQLSTRALNTIQKLCYADSLEVLISQLQAIQFDYTKLKSVGGKTADELKNFVIRLSEILNKESLTKHSEELRQKMLIDQIEDSAKGINDDIKILLSNNFHHLEDGEFPLLKLFDLLIRYSGIVEEKRRTLLLEHSGFFHRNIEVSHVEISKRTGFPKERIRQLFQNDQIHFKTIEQLGVVFQILKNFGLSIPKGLSLNSQYHSYRFEYLNDGSNFTNFFLGFLLSILNPRYQIIPFDVRDEKLHLLINKSLMEKVDLLSLFKKIQEITQARNEENFEISLPGFIAMYYTQDLSMADQEKINIDIADLLFELYGLFPDENNVLEIKRNTKKKVWEYIYEIIKAKGKPLHVSEISIEINKLGFEFEPDNVRGHTLRQDNIFVVAGSSTYGLKEWEHDGRMIGGTIKQIIEKYLASFNEPKHLYDIARHVMRQRDTNVHSVHGNIMSDPHYKFRSFGEQFYGLTAKEYPEPLTQFTSVNRHWFKEVEKLFAGQKSPLLKLNIIQYVADLLQVKPVQIEYLLDERVKKGELIETEEELSLK